MPYFRAEIPNDVFDQLVRFLTPYCQSLGLPDSWLNEVDFWVFLCTILFSGVLLPLFLTELKAANEFIKQCKVLEKAMPNTKIYY